MGNKAVISKQRILETASSLFRQSGASTLSVRSVAAACGVSVGSIYNYFPTKADLVAEVVGAFWRESLHREMFIAASGENFVSFCERLLEDLRSTLEEFRRDLLAQLKALDTESLHEVRRREEAAFAHIRKGLVVAMKNDPGMHLEAIGGEEAADRLAAVVWSSMVSSLERDDDSCTVLFALMRAALY